MWTEVYRLRLNGAALVGPDQAVVKKEESNTMRTAAIILTESIEAEFQLGDYPTHWLVTLLSAASAAIPLPSYRRMRSNIQGNPKCRDISHRKNGIHPNFTYKLGLRLSRRIMSDSG